MTPAFKFTKGIFLITVLMMSCSWASAQNTKDPDSLFAQARAAAFDQKDYPKAINLSKQALRLAPGYTDIVVFLGRLYTWNKQTDSARYYLDLALRQKPGHEEALYAYTDL